MPYTIANMRRTDKIENQRQAETLQEQRRIINRSEPLHQDRGRPEGRLLSPLCPQMVPEVCHIYCATANPVEVIIAETDQGRGILGVVDGLLTKGIEEDEDIQWRKDFLRTIGYKLG